MRRVLTVLATAAALAGTTGTAAASLPVPTPDHNGQSNTATTTQGGNTATGGPATATGGNGGNAKTGNVQILNGNSIAIGDGAHAEGGDTSATSGNATGGDGGNAGATGGDADVVNVTASDQKNMSQGGHHGAGSQSNQSTVDQGSNKAEGGAASAAGGNGGDADTGNTQVLNGNSVALAPPSGKSGTKGDGCDPCAGHGRGHDEHPGASAHGGSTTATSGDAQGGRGGDAHARGGDAAIGNIALVDQADKVRGEGPDSERHDARSAGTSQSNTSAIDQGHNTVSGGPASATGGDGGEARTGNDQWGNGNAYAKSWGAHADGGDTTAHSGDAWGGDGGDAHATGGDAYVGNVAHTTQRSTSKGDMHGRGAPCQRPEPPCQRPEPPCTRPQRPCDEPAPCEHQDRCH